MYTAVVRRCATHLPETASAMVISEDYRRSGLVISREQGLRYDSGFAVPVLIS